MKPWFILSWLIAAGLANAQAQNPCGSLVNYAYGPFDYRSASNDQKSLVEGAHFTPGVEMLQTRKTGAFGHDIGYTLRAFPNHPRALVAMQRLVEKEKRNPAEGAPYTIDCFYERALRFQPSDYLVRLLFATFLVSRGESTEVGRHLAYVSDTQADNPFAMYNVGLIYFDMKNYDQALLYAQKAMKMGLMRGDLKAKLEAVHKWADPAPDAPTDAASAPEPASSGVR
ncbi:MAG: hypothetical protein HY020_24805 [Burkholderiales bacterium]|nr:hypothetical protein [Burkholderiales bacterium]